MSDQRILAIDIGAGTQDILLHDPERLPENQFRMVMPSRTQIVAAEIRAVTDRGLPLHLSGTVMGGGASTEAITAHLAAGLPVTASATAAQTIHNRPERVAALGVVVQETPPPGACEVVLGDVDLTGLSASLRAFGLSLPEKFAFAVQDHGVATGRGNNDVRGDYLTWLVTRGRTLQSAAFLQPPPEMTRMGAIASQVPGAMIMDTGAAALLGSLHDPVVAAAAEQGAVLVNIGNMHTFAALIYRDRVLGVLEHHSRGMNAGLLTALVRHLQRRDLTNAQFRERFDGHGVVLAEDIDPEMAFGFVAITGPNRGLARETDWYFAAPHGDMMLTGSFGLVSGYLAATSVP